MRTTRIPVNSWVWVYNPRARPPEGDKINTRKLAVSWAGPYLFEGMDNDCMAQVAHIDEAGQVHRRFKVHGSKIRVCYWGGYPEDDQQYDVVRPGMLPDFPDSEVSKPMYVMVEP